VRISVLSSGPAPSHHVPLLDRRGQVRLIRDGAVSYFPAGLSATVLQSQPDCQSSSTPTVSPCPGGELASWPAKLVGEPIATAERHRPCGALSDQVPLLDRRGQVRLIRDGAVSDAALRCPATSLRIKSVCQSSSTPTVSPCPGGGLDWLTSTDDKRSAARRDSRGSGAVSLDNVPLRARRGQVRSMTAIHE